MVHGNGLRCVPTHSGAVLVCRQPGMNRATSRIWSAAVSLPPPVYVHSGESVLPQVLSQNQTKVLFTKIVAHDIVLPGTNSRAGAEQCHSATQSLR